MVILSTINYQACLSLIPVNAKHWSLLSCKFKKIYEFSLLFYQYVRNLKKYKFLSWIFCKRKPLTLQKSHSLSKIPILQHTSHTKMLTQALHDWLVLPIKAHLQYKINVGFGNKWILVKLSWYIFLPGKEWCDWSRQQAGCIQTCAQSFPKLKNTLEVMK